ncbi:MAG: hypothetical protein OEZ38_00600 [Gammaproteobacteria bacterium]|nr:hypothetical protein [Gammaproteobacteria bacterium]
MSLFTYTNSQLKRRSRLLVIVFVVTWINMAFQMPVHGAMMQQQSVAEQMSMDCHCPPAVCDVVLAGDNQSLDGIKIFSITGFNFTSNYVSDILDDRLTLESNREFFQSELVFLAASSPPILFNTVLLI